MLFPFCSFTVNDISNRDVTVDLRHRSAVQMYATAQHDTRETAVYWEHLTIPPVFK